MTILVDLVVLVFSVEVFKKLFEDFDIRNCIIFRLSLTVWRAGICMAFGTGSYRYTYSLECWLGSMRANVHPHHVEIEVGQLFRFKKLSIMSDSTHYEITFRGKRKVWNTPPNNPFPTCEKSSWR